MSDKEQLSILIYRLEETAKKVDQIHQALFGAEGHGGLNRMVEDHERQLRDLQQHKAKALGVAAVLTIIGGAIGAKLISFFK